MTKNLISQSLLRAVSEKSRQSAWSIIRIGAASIALWNSGSCLHNSAYWCRWASRGNGYDNAPHRELLGNIENELFHHRRYTTRSDAIRKITEYIEIFYNRQRRQRRSGLTLACRYTNRNI